MPGALAALATVELLFGLAALVYQAYTWLQEGYWLPISVAKGLSFFGIVTPISTVADIQAALDWWLSTSAAGNLFLASVAVYLIAVVSIDWSKPDARHKRRSDIPGSQRRFRPPD